MSYPPFTCIWTGDAFVLAAYQRTPLNFAEGARYTIEVIPQDRERTHASHGHYFAMINEYWQNLPERLMGESWSLTADTLRDFALVSTKWSEATPYTCGSRAEAVRWYEMLPVPRNRDGRALWHMRDVRGSVLTVITPMSQDYRSMKNREFQKSKDDVLAFLADLVGAEVKGTAA